MTQATAIIQLRDYPRPRGAGFFVLIDARHPGGGVWLADCDLEAGPAGIQAACGQIRQRLAELSPGILDGTTPWEPADMQPWAAQRLRECLAGGS